MSAYLAAGALFPVSLALILFSGLVVALAWAPLRREGALRRQLDRVREAHAPTGLAAASGRHAWFTMVVAPVGRLLARSGILSSRAVADLEATLSSAGMRGGSALPVFVGAKALLLLLMPALGWALAQQIDAGSLWTRLILAAAAVLGLMAPDIVLRGVRRRYLAAVERGMPDALDLLVICAEAGLALEQGMERVAREIRISSGPCAVELSLTHSELRILADRRAALINMGRRTGLVSLQRLAGTLAQALQYGTPLSQALRALAADLRTEALTRFESRAARLPVLMTLPMILFILPCVFLVVAGPAAIAILATIRHP